MTAPLGLFLACITLEAAAVWAAMSHGQVASVRLFAAALGCNTAGWVLWAGGRA